MNGVFNPEEVLQIACTIERNGSLFYREAARQVKNEQVRDMLLELAQMEDDHEVTFENMRADPDVLAEVLGDDDGTVVSYLGAIADGYVFPVDAKPASFVTPDMSVEEVLRKAISLERDSIVFYQGLRELMPQKQGRQKVDDIIHQEMGHIATLSEALSLMNKSLMKKQE